QAGDTKVLEIRDVRIDYGDPARPEAVMISSARLEATDDGAFAMTGEIAAADRAFSIETRFSRGTADADAEVDLVVHGTMPIAGGDQPLPLEHVVGAFTLSLPGRENVMGGRQLVASLDVEEAGVRIGNAD